MSSNNENELASWLDDIPPELVLLGVELLILWLVIPSAGLWFLSKKALVIGVMGLSILIAPVVYFYAEPVLWRGVGFITLIGHAKRKNLAHRRKHPDQLSFWDTCVSRGVSWTRHIRDGTNTVWTKTRRWITPNDESPTDQQTELPPAQSVEPNDDTTDEPDENDDTTDE